MVADINNIPLDQGVTIGGLPWRSDSAAEGPSWTS